MPAISRKSGHGRLALEALLALALVRREAQKTEDEIRGLKEARRESVQDDVLSKAARREGEALPRTAEAYVRISAPVNAPKAAAQTDPAKVTVQGIGDVVMYGYITFTVDSSSVKAENRVVTVQGPSNDNMGWMTTYHTNLPDAA